jgi:hypothetical protein
MSYLKLTDFAAKDALVSGNPLKTVKGTEIGAEFDAIATASALTDSNLAVETAARLAAVTAVEALKANIASPTFTGTVTSPRYNVGAGFIYSTPANGTTFVPGGGTNADFILTNRANNLAVLSIPPNTNNLFMHGSVAIGGALTVTGAIIGSLTGGLTGNVTGNVLGNLTGNATTATTAGTVTTAAQPAITSVGTLSSLNVTGTVTAGSFSGPITTDIITVRRSTDQTFTNSATVLLNTVDNVNGAFTTGSLSGGLVTIPTAGLYEVSWCLTLLGTTNGYVSVVGGGTASSMGIPILSNGTQGVAGLTRIGYFAAGAAVYMIASMDNLGAGTIRGSQAYYTYMCIRRVG